ncbi:MAG: alpha-2-macroglobulin family protein, partial [Chitinophagales bacterium]
YEIRVYNPEVNGSYVSSRFYAYGYGKTYLSSFEVDNEGRIDIESNKDSYEVGDDATILFKTPFQGKMLVTVESGEVLEHFIVNTDKRSAEITIPMKKEYLPNVYLSATLIKAHVESEFPLTVAHGFKSINVVDSKREMAVSINAAPSSRSKTKQTIKVKGAPNALLSVAVVDEGILQVGGFKTPRPYDYFYQKRALMVSSYDLYPFLLPEISSSNSSGGDEGFDMSKRVNPFQNKRVKLVSYWSGLLQTNSSGEASYEIDIPQFSGSLRIMAVGHKGNSFGSAESSMTVADPIVISTAIPRFLSPGDTAYLSTTLSNTTEKSTSAKASISVSGALKVIGVSKESVNIKAGSEERVIFKVYAGNELGAGKITVTCDAFNENFKEITDIGVRPAVPLLKQNGSGTILASSSSKLNMQQSNLLESTSAYKLVISKNPMVEFAKDLDYLVRYPYGCSEQTISTAFPQLYYEDLIKSMYNKTDKSMNINQNILVSINKLKMRQLYNGSIAMWDNCNCESWWVSVYAAHFLIEAKKAGFSVDEDFLESILAYLKNRLKSKETVNYYYSRNLNKKIAPKEVAYSLYVLALANKADLSLMNYYKSNTEILALDSKYLLAAAYVLAGDKEKAKVLLPSNFSSEESVQQFGGSFYSPIRDEAIALNALLEIDPNHKEIGVMAKHISQYLKSTSYINTQERIFSILALGKLSKLANQSDLSASVLINGKNVATYESGVMSFGTADLKNKEVEIKVSGKGKLYYFWESEGISKDGSFKEEDSYLMVRKSFYDRYGNPITNKRFKQNDLIVIKLSIKASYNGTVNNVVITDMLPAGFEIENPRIDDVPGTQWIKNKSYPDYLDIRDDRINIFDDIYAVNGNTQDYYYVVRAVSPGVYKMGPVGADAMYNGEYHSYHGGGYIKIVE